MANITTNEQLRVKQFKKKFFQEYIRENLFFKYTGRSENNIICIEDGKQECVIPLIAEFDGGGVMGNETLDGNEDFMNQYDFRLVPTYIRNGFRVSKEEKEKPAFDIMMGAKSMIKKWGLSRVRDDIIHQGMGSFQSNGTYTFVRNEKNKGNNTAAAINAAADAWLTNNSDRVLYGAAQSNLVAGDHSASLANVDSTNDKLTGDIVMLAREMARTCDPKITPVMTTNGVETFVMFVGTRSFTHLQKDLETVHANAQVRGTDNPLFKTGDLYWSNVVIREIPEITTLLADSDYYATAGNTSSKVEPAFLCGCQAVGYGLGQEPDLIIDRDKDWGFQPGVAVEMKHQIRKMAFKNKDHGMVTVFLTGV